MSSMTQPTLRRMRQPRLRPSPWVRMLLIAVLAALVGVASFERRSGPSPVGGYAALAVVVQKQGPEVTLSTINLLNGEARRQCKCFDKHNGKALLTHGDSRCDRIKSAAKDGECLVRNCIRRYCARPSSSNCPYRFMWPKCKSGVNTAWGSG